jgi:hypothetical protein
MVSNCPLTYLVMLFLYHSECTQYTRMAGGNLGLTYVQKSETSMPLRTHQLEWHLCVTGTLSTSGTNLCRPEGILDFLPFSHLNRYASIKSFLYCHLR